MGHPTAYDAGRYRDTYDALNHWIGNNLPFTTRYYSNLEIPQP